MTVTKELFGDLQEKYEKVLKLINEDSKHDPETEPFLSKYSARQTLIGMNASLENYLKSTITSENNEFIKLIGKWNSI